MQLEIEHKFVKRVYEHFGLARKVPERLPFRMLVKNVEEHIICMYEAGISAYVMTFQQESDNGTVSRQ